MKIGIDCSNILHPAAGESAGVGHYVHHLVTELLAQDRTNQYVLFFDNHDVARAKHELVQGRPNVTARVLPFRTMRKALPFIYRHMVVAGVFEREKLDLLHGPANSVPMFYRRPWTVTVHDLAIYDHPEWFPSGQKFATEVVVPHSIEHALRIIAVSQTTAADIKRLFKVRPDRIDVIPEGVTMPPANAPDEFATSEERAALGARDLAPQEYFLFVGTLEPRKNIVTMVRAFALAASEGRIPVQARLAIAGGRGWKNADILAAVREANRQLRAESVLLLGYVSAAEKITLMRHARAFVFPSWYEGFGLPVLEAMALGTPVIASNTPALAETCGDAAWLIPPDDVSALAFAMTELWHDVDHRASRRTAGIYRAAQFTWHAAAEATRRSYELAGQVTVRTDDHDAA